MNTGGKSTLRRLAASAKMVHRIMGNMYRRQQCRLLRETFAHTAIVDGPVGGNTLSLYTDALASFMGTSVGRGNMICRSTDSLAPFMGTSAGGDNMISLYTSTPAAIIAFVLLKCKCGNHSAPVLRPCLFAVAFRASLQDIASVFQRQYVSGRNTVCLFVASFRASLPDNASRFFNGTMFSGRKSVCLFVVSFRASFREVLSASVLRFCALDFNIQSVLFTREVRVRLKSSRLVEAGTKTAAFVRDKDPRNRYEMITQKETLQFSCDEFVILYKPHGIPTVPLKNQNLDGTLLECAVRIHSEIIDVHGRNTWEGGALHRLDTETAGLVVFARTQDFYEKLSEMQNKGFFIKEYLAATDGGISCPSVIESYFRAFGPGRRRVRPELDAKRSDNGVLYRTFVKPSACFPSEQNVESASGYNLLTERAAEGELASRDNTFASDKTKVTSGGEPIPVDKSELAASGSPAPVDKGELAASGSPAPVDKSDFAWNAEPAATLRDAQKAALCGIRGDVPSTANAGTKESITPDTSASSEPGTVYHCWISKGFRHQIRSHLAWKGCPIKGDSLYNPSFREGEILQLECIGVKWPGFEFRTSLDDAQNK